MHLTEQHKQCVRGCRKFTEGARQDHRQSSKGSSSLQSTCHLPFREAKPSWVQHRRVFNASSKLDSFGKSRTLLLGISLPCFGQRCRFHAMDAGTYVETLSSDDSCMSRRLWALLEILPIVHGTRARCISFGYERETQRNMDLRLWERPSNGRSPGTSRTRSSHGNLVCTCSTSGHGRLSQDLFVYATC